MTMNNETEVLSESDEIAALLPWYVTGRITAEDRAKVDSYAATHPDVKRQISIAREEADQIFSANAEIEGPHFALDKLLKSVAESPSARLHAAGTSIVDKLGNFIASLAPRQLAYAAMTGALALALALVAGGIGARLVQPPGEYTVASKEGASAGVGTFALVSLQPGAPAGTLSAFLAENALAIVDGPKAGGIYRLRLSTEVLSEDAQKSALDKVKARTDLFAFVAAAPQSN